MQQPALDYLRHGQIPFFRLPELRERREVDVAILGVPHDGGTTYQPGARFAPYHVRRVSALVQGHHPHHNIDVFDRVRCVDGGNVVFPPFDRAAMRMAVEAEVRDLAAHRIAPVMVGGDHSITLPALRALVKQLGPLAVVHFDAHLDVSGADVWGDDHHHGTPIRHAIDEGLIEVGQLYQIGIRGPRGGAGDDAIARAAHHTIITADAVGEREPKRVCAELRERIGARPVYVTFDVDAVDPAFAPGTGTPVPGGLTAREALALVRGLAGLAVIGGDVVEVCPPLDHADVTSHLASHLLWELLATIAIARRG
ncbi:MAG TPA: agmatinase [Kofleriaceae bacterium]|nr:agmatinase [Kofleriaceae bacterium]